MFQILPHTADVKIRARGKDYQELFKNAMLGMMEILSPSAKEFERKAKKEKRKIIVESSDVNNLLIDFLNEVLYQTQVNREIYTDVKFIKFPKMTEVASPSRLEIKAELFGHPVSEFKEDIKAATYHGKGIKKTSAGFEIIILFDI